MKEKIIISGHEAVDLGLSVKWATCNIGASKPEEYGDYFAWGETEPKDKYANENYMLIMQHGSTHNDIGTVISGTKFDAAHALWGGSWRMPTLAEIQELCNKCIWKWTKLNGIKGQLVTGPNGNSIFMPAAGFRYDTCCGDCGSRGQYWSATSNGNSCNAHYMLFYLNFGASDALDNGSWCGNSIRPVTE